jgi:uncharacterized protein (UPF0333 family)
MMRKSKGQSIIEYAIVLSIVTAAIMAMQTYIKRGIQGVVKVAADEMKMSEDGVGQFEGMQESGLVDYQQIGGPLTINIEKNITLVESPAGGADSLRKVTINTDETKTKGDWQVLYSLEEAEVFRASGMAKKPPKTKQKTKKPN